MKLTLLIALAATLAALAVAAPTLSQVDADDTLLESLQTQFETSMENDVRPVRYIRITQPASNHLCFSWLACYDLAGNNVCAERNNRLGQHTSSGNGNPHPDPWGLTAPVLSPVENTGTGTGNCYCSAAANAGNYWQVDLGSNGVILKSIKYRTRNDHPSYGMSVVITLWDKVFATQFSLFLLKMLTNLLMNRTTGRSWPKAHSSQRQPPRQQLRHSMSPKTLWDTLASMTSTFPQSWLC
jgi:hypothetical protein